jgi:hypothetical protein
MMYSSWRPAEGGYDYFDSPVRIGLGDDMPVPSLPRGTDIGVASTDIGRPAPSGLRHVGRGPTARGAILPLSRSGLSSSLGSFASGVPLWVAIGVFAAGATAVAWVVGKKRSAQ